MPKLPHVLYLPARSRAHVQHVAAGCRGHGSLLPGALRLSEAFYNERGACLVLRPASAAHGKCQFGEGEVSVLTCASVL